MRVNACYVTNKLVVSLRKGRQQVGRGGFAHSLFSRQSIGIFKCPSKVLQKAFKCPLFYFCKCLIYIYLFSSVSSVYLFKYIYKWY